ncbi:uncharacterized protein [Clytia hemisphaerica]|uniref:uncharacterized protein n=1 Tax=Clytia hemisphaerica TaxID=252671 RepID=UPI0034D6FB99
MKIIPKLSLVGYFYLLAWICQTVCDRTQTGEVPKNNHGFNPAVLIGEEEKEVKRNSLIAIVPILSPEWSVKLDMRWYNETIISSDSRYACSILQLSANGLENGYGCRVPFIGMGKNSKKFAISSAVNGNSNHKIPPTPPIVNINKTYHVEVQQRYVSNGNYRYDVLIDGVEVYSVLNTDARQFYNVHVYAGNPWNDPCPVYISNLKLTNFL